MDTARPAVELPLDRPSVARMYDYFLGGAHNFAVDRAAAERVIALSPDVPLLAQVNRAFLRRAVRYLVGEGVEQFLDIGSGIPTVGNVHEVAQRANPSARVVYADVDPIAVAHSQAILADNPRAIALQADARAPEHILAQPEVRRLLDLGRPLAVLLVALLHFIPDDAEVLRLVATLRAETAPGSFLVISHVTRDRQRIPVPTGDAVRRVYADTPHPIRARSQADMERLFAGFELVPPGIVHSPRWRPDGPKDLLLDQPERAATYAAVGRKP